jgi:CelD/BcsL family acetyltransferase involved in cellulose biosynthesis
MNIELYSAQDLPGDLLARWDEIQRATLELASPYFRPEYVQAVAALRPNVEVAALRDGETIVGLFPFERQQRVVARPVGLQLSDYQGVIATPGMPWSVAELLDGCRLKAWEFDHQLAGQTQLTPFFEQTAKSPTIDLSAGYEAWLANRRKETTALVEQLRKMRKLQRECNVRFEWHTADEAVFSQLLAWKSQQYLRTGVDDLFTIGWIAKLVRSIWQTDRPTFRGVLCALYANDQLVAAHFCMHSGPILHSWFPAYDMEFGKYSPGMALMFHMAQEAVARGITCIDLGKGSEDYKLALASGAVELGEGAVDTRVLAAAMRSSWRRARDWVKQTPLHRPARASLRWLRSVKHKWLGGVA